MDQLASVDQLHVGTYTVHVHVRTLSILTATECLNKSYKRTFEGLQKLEGVATLVRL